MQLGIRPHYRRIKKARPRLRGPRNLPRELPHGFGRNGAELAPRPHGLLALEMPFHMRRSSQRVGPFGSV